MVGRSARGHPHHPRYSGDSLRWTQRGTPIAMHVPGSFRLRVVDRSWGLHTARGSAWVLGNSGARQTADWRRSLRDAGQRASARCANLQSARTVTVRRTSGSSPLMLARELPITPRGTGPILPDHVAPGGRQSLRHRLRPSTSRPGSTDRRVVPTGGRLRSAPWRSSSSSMGRHVTFHRRLRAGRLHADPRPPRRHLRRLIQDPLPCP